jgi:hypothetical protein
VSKRGWTTGAYVLRGLLLEHVVVVVIDLFLISWSAWVVVIRY